MAGDKRTVLSSKRARDRRQRAQRRASNKRQLDDASHAPVLATRTAAPLEPLLAMRVQLSDESEKTNRNAPASPTGADDVPGAVNDEMGDNEYDDEMESDDDDDDELVIVCRATLPDFCTRFVPAEQAANPNARGGRFCEFTASIPSFRETSDGFTTYTIALTTGSERFELERRYSEFVALASALRGGSCDAPSDASTVQRGHASEGSEAEESDDAIDQPTARTEAKDGFEWELPPKTWFKVTQLPALEERRRQLEQSLARLLEQQAMSRRAVVRDFLMLDIFGAQVAEATQRRAGE